MALTQEQVSQLYVAIFNRASEGSGNQNWQNQNLSMAEVANLMLATDDAKEYFGSSLDSNRAFIEHIYLNTLSKTPAQDPNGIQNWINQLEGGMSRGEVVAKLIEAIYTYSDSTDPVTKAAYDQFTNRVEVSNYTAEHIQDVPTDYKTKLGFDGDLNVTNDDATVTSAEAVIDNIAIGGQSFTLTTNADAVPGLQGSEGTTDSSGNDTYIATEATLGSGDNIVDAGGSNDTFRYASSDQNPAAATNESGFSIKGVENIHVTADNAQGTTFDMTGVEDATTYVNDNSSENLTTTGVQNLVDVKMKNVNDGDTTIQFVDSVLSGTTDSVNLTLDNVQSDTSTATSTLNMGNTTSNGQTGIETLNINTEHKASLLTAITTGAATVNITGDQNLTITNDIEGATTINASTFTGNLDIDTDSNGTAKDVVVTGGSGDDSVDFSDGFEAGDSFDGGDGIDTLGLTNAIATGTPGGTSTNVEQLSISDGATGTIDMDNFVGITKVILDGGFAGDVVISDAVTGISIEADQPTATANDLTVNLKTDGSSDEVTILFDDIDDGDLAGVVTVNDAETLNLNGSILATGASQDLTIANLSATDATTLNITSDAALDLSNANTTALTTVDASASTGNLDLENLDLAAAGATVTLGEGDDTISSGAGADTFTGKGGMDSYVYNNSTDSDSAGFDTIKDFVSGEDVINLLNLTGANINSASLFAGSFNDFGSAQGALNPNSTGDAVFEANYDGNGNGRLWVDVDDNGTLDNSDLRIVLEGVSSLSARDLGLGIAGNTITLNAAGANVQLSGSTNTENGANSTDKDDTILTTAAFLEGSTIDGLVGDDTVKVTTDATGSVDLTNVAGGSAIDANLNNIEAVIFDNTTGVVNIGGNNNGEDITINSSSTNAGALTVTTTADRQDIVVNNTSGTNASNITLSNNTALTVLLGSAADNVFAVQTADANIKTGAGNDTVELSAAAADGATVDGGTGINTILGNGGIVLDLSDGTFTNFQTLDLNDVGAANQTVTLIDGFRTITMGDANDDVNLTASQLSELTTIDANADGDGDLILSATGDADITDATIAATNDLASLQYSGAGNNVTMSLADSLGFQAITGGAGTDTLTLDLEGGARVFLSAGTGGDGVVTNIENLVVVDSGTGGTVANGTTIANASGIVSIDSSAITTDQDWDISGLTTANGNTTVTLGSGADTLTNGISGAGGNNLTVDFGSGNATVADIAAGGAGVFEFNMDTSATNTTSLTFAATTADLAAGDIFDFNQDVTSITNNGVNGNAGQVIVTAGANTTILFDADGDTAYGAGDILITLTGQNIDVGGFSIVNGDLVFA